MLSDRATKKDIELGISNVKGGRPEVDQEIASLWDLGDENSVKMAGRLVNYIHARRITDSIEQAYPQFGRGRHLP
jgi:hypothetical protein